MFTLSPFLFCLSDSCSPQIDPHLISSMAFTITLGFSEFNVATFIGVFLCSSLQASVSEPQGDQFCSISNSLENRREYRREAEANTLAATGGLVLQPGFHFKMWMDSKPCAVIGAKNTLTHPAYTLSSWHVLGCIFIITLRHERLSMNGCWSWRWEKPTVDLLL